MNTIMLLNKDILTEKIRYRIGKKISEIYPVVDFLTRANSAAKRKSVGGSRPRDKVPAPAARRPGRLYEISSLSSGCSESIL